MTEFDMVTDEGEASLYGVNHAPILRSRAPG